MACKLQVFCASAQKVKGVQLAGVANVAKEVNGVQVGGLVNQAKQIKALNWPHKLRQISFAAYRLAS